MNKYNRHRTEEMVVSFMTGGKITTKLIIHPCWRNLQWDLDSSNSSDIKNNSNVVFNSTSVDNGDKADPCNSIIIIK